MRTRPLAGISAPSTSFSSVDLPHPVWPSRQTNSPASMLRLMLLRMGRGGIPYATERFSISIRAIASALLKPGMQLVIYQAHCEIDKEKKQRNPKHVGDDDVHAHVAAEQSDAVREAVGGGDHFSGEEE